MADDIGSLSVRAFTTSLLKSMRWRSRVYALICFHHLSTPINATSSLNGKQPQGLEKKRSRVRSPRKIYSSAARKTKYSSIQQNRLSTIKTLAGQSNCLYNFSPLNRLTFKPG